MIKKLVMVDLDGVLNHYNGNFEEDFIPPAREDAYSFLKILSRTYRVKLFTCREKALAKKWLQDNFLDDFIEDITDVKEPAYAYVDDRAVRFKDSVITAEEINNLDFELKVIKNSAFMN